MYYSKSDLKDYGFQELESQLDWIITESMEDTYELSDLVFNGAESDQSLTFSAAQAEEEILQDFNFREVFEFLDERGIDMHTASETMHAEVIHVMLAKEGFNEYMNDLYVEKFENAQFDTPEIVDAWNEELTNKEKVLATIMELPEEYLEIDINNYPELKKVQEKMQKIENEVINGLDNDQDINSSHKEPIKKYELTDETFEFKTNQKSQKKPMLEMSKPNGKGFER